MKDSDRIPFYIEFKSPASHELHFRRLKEFFDKPVKSPDIIFKKWYPYVLQEKKWIQGSIVNVVYLYLGKF